MKKETPDQSSSDMLAESSFVRAFVVPARRDRYLGLLESRGGRQKMRRKLAHFSDLDPRFSTRLKEATPEAIAAVMRRNGAPELCYVFSESAAIDAKTLDLDLVLADVVGGGMGTLLLCLPGNLAYYEAEDLSTRFLLKRTCV